MQRRVNQQELRGRHPIPGCWPVQIRISAIGVGNRVSMTVPVTIKHEKYAQADPFASITCLVWSRYSTGLKRRGLQPRLVSSDCLLRGLDKAYNPASP